MAIYHIDFKILKRSDGKSSCYLAAYHTRTRIEDDRTGNLFDYSYRSDLFHHAILAPESTPNDLIKDSATLWNTIEQLEKRKDAQLSRYFDVAIPTELGNKDKIELVLEYCQKNFVDKGMIADIAFHDLNSKNPHAHVMLTLREITPDGFGMKNRNWNERSLMEEWRSSWASLSNDALNKIGSDARIDHRSLEAQKQEQLIIAETAKAEGKEQEANQALAKAIELNRPALTRINRRSWHTTRSKTLRQQEQQEAEAAKQRARDFRQLFTGTEHLITVNLETYIIEPRQKTPERPAPQPELVIPTNVKHFASSRNRKREMSLSPVYGQRSRAAPPTLLRRKRRLTQSNLQTLYEFIKGVLNKLLRKRSPVSVDTQHIPDPVTVEDPTLNDIIVDPVTGLKITRKQWDMMGKDNKSVSVLKSADKNNSSPDNQSNDAPSSTVSFPPLPKETSLPENSMDLKVPKP